MGNENVPANPTESWLEKMPFFVSAVVYITTYNAIEFATPDRVQVRDYGRFEQILQLASCGSQKESGMILKIYQI